MQLLNLLRHLFRVLAVFEQLLLLLAELDDFGEQGFSLVAFNQSVRFLLQVVPRLTHGATTFPMTLACF